MEGILVIVPLVVLELIKDKFHAKFAESNNLLLANSIANKIEDERLREDTLSEISKRIISVEKDMKD